MKSRKIIEKIGNIFLVSMYLLANGLIFILLCGALFIVIGAVSLYFKYKI